MVDEKEFDVVAYRTGEPYKFRRVALKAFCFEEAVSRAYVWRTRQGHFHEWQIASIALADNKKGHL